MAEAEKDVLRNPEQRPSLSAWQGFLLLFRKGYRARTILALFVLGMIQLSGIDGVLYYAPTLFAQAGLPGETAAFLASGLSAILMLAISIPAFVFADKWGRRTSVISGGVGLSGCMLLIGTLYASNSVHPYGIARGWSLYQCLFSASHIARRGAPLVKSMRVKYSRHTLGLQQTLWLKDSVSLQISLLPS